MENVPEWVKWSKRNISPKVKITNTDNTSQLYLKTKITGSHNENSDISIECQINEDLTVYKHLHKWLSEIHDPQEIGDEKRSNSFKKIKDLEEEVKILKSEKEQLLSSKNQANTNSPEMALKIQIEKLRNYLEKVNKDFDKAKHEIGFYKVNTQILEDYIKELKDENIKLRNSLALIQRPIDPLIEQYLMKLHNLMLDYTQEERDCIKRYIESISKNILENITDE